MMKKYLMMGLAAMAIASCSNNDSAYDASRDKVHDTYNAAFRQYVGVSIAPNQTWGFGADATRGFEDYTRAVRHNINFPDAPASYPSSYGDAAEYTGNYKYINGEAIYMANETITNVEVQGNGSLYLAKSANGNGSYTPSSKWYVGNVTYSADNSYKIKVYLLPGVTLNLSADQNNFQQNVEFYLSPGAKIVCANELWLNSAALYIASGAIVSATNLQANGTGILYNQGTVSLSGDIAVKNANSFIVNEGSISAANYGSEGSGSFWNVSGGEVNISGTTTVNSNSNGWVNDGQYTTGTFLYNAGSVNVWNNCKLTCTELFDMTLGDSSTSSFQMDGGAGIVAASFHIAGPARINMGPNSVIKVTGTAILDCRKADYGIYGPASGDYAVFQANKIEKGIDNQGYEVTYGNNLYIYSETTHFANGNSGQYPYIDFKGNCKEANIYASNFTSGKPTVTITETECNPGFEGDKEIQPTGADIRVICEDLSANEATDFDFNDVVFDVKFTSATSATVTIVAAGGTLPLEVAGHEVHAAFNVSDTKTMINTKAARILTEELKKQGYKALDGLTAQSFTVNGIDRTKLGEDIPVRVQKDGQWYTIEATVGGPTAKIGVDPRFVWPNEKQSIKSKYEGFTGWVTDPTKLWY